MDLSDFAQAAHAAKPRAAGAPAAALLHPHELVAQLGSEVASTLSSALERVSALAATGRIGRIGLRALRDEIDLARRIGIMGQQVVRLGHGKVQLADERLDLTALLREALRQRGREIQARGIEVRQVVAAAEVSSDATLLYALLQTLLDWSFEHAVSRIDIGLDVKRWPAHACLNAGFAHRPPDEVDTATAPLEGIEVDALNTMSWRLLQQTASVLGLLMQRRDTPGKTTLTIEFAHTLRPRLQGLDLAAANAAAGGDTVVAANSQPLAGRHVLLLAAQREVRSAVREALRTMGLVLDTVGSIDEAQQLGATGLPHAVVYEAALAGEGFDRLRSDWVAEVPGLAFIQIAEHGRAFEVLNLGGRQFASVGRDAIFESLPAALLFELSRAG